MTKLRKLAVILLVFSLLTPSFAFAANGSSPMRTRNVVEQPKMTKAIKRELNKNIPDSDKPSLEGCEFGVYADEDAKTLIDTVKIVKTSDGVYEGVNRGGETLPAGKVYVKETKAAKGYLLNKNVYPVDIKTGEQVPLTIKNDLDIVTPVLEKTSNKTKVRVGDTVTYTVTMTNPSETGTAYNAAITDFLDSGNSAVILPDTVKGNLDGKAFTSFDVKDDHNISTTPIHLKPGETLTVTYDVKVVSHLKNGVLKNTLKSKLAKPSEVFGIVTSVENGKIDESVDNINHGKSQTINYTPNDGYHLVKVLVDDQEVDIEKYPSAYTFDNISTDHKIHVVYEGTVNIEDPVKTFDKESYYKGETIKNEITVKQSGVAASVAKNVVITDKNTEDFEIDTDSIKAEIVGDNGSSKPEVKVVDKNTGEFTVTIPEFKGGDKVKVTFESKALNKTATITNKGTLKGDNQKELIFEAKANSVYKIATEVVNGTIDKSKDNVKFGSTEKINYQPKEGYHIKKVTVDGKEVDKNDFAKSYDFSNIKDNHSIKVEYEATAVVSDPEKKFDKKSYHTGDVVNSTITAKQKGVSGSVSKDVVISDKNTNTLEIDTDSINAEIAGNNGSSKPEVKVVNKDTGEFIVTIAEFKGGDSVKISFKGKALNTESKIMNKAKVTADGKDLDVTAEADAVFKINTKVINGKIDDSKSDIAYGNNETINYSPKEGYELKKITVDGKEVDKDTFKDKYNFEKISKDHEITVEYEGINKPVLEKTFDKKEYKIGDIIKNTIIFKNDGVSDAIIKNLVISDKNKDGVAIDTDSINVIYNGVGKYVVNVVDAVKGEFNVVFDQLKGGETVTITFNSLFKSNTEKVENDATANGDNMKEINAHAEATPKYVITTEVVNGTISPNQEVVKGGDSKIEYTPNDGYKLKKITVDGNDVTGHPENYTFEKVKDNHKIKVEYEGIPRPTINKTFDKGSYKVGDVVKAAVVVKDTGKPTAVNHNIVVADANQVGFKIKTDTIKATVSKSTERTGSTDEPTVNVVDAEKGIFNVTLASMDTTQMLTITYDMEITRESGTIKNKATLKTTEYPNEVPSEATSKLTFDVGTKVIGGKITPPKNDVPFGSNVVISYTPDEENYLDKISIDGKEVKKDKIEKSYTFTGIENNHNIEVIYKKIPTPKIEKKADKTDYIKGDIAKYAVTVTNGDSEVEDVVLKDVFEKAKIDAGVLELDKTSIKIDGKKVDYAESYKFDKLEANAKVVLTYEAKILKDEDNMVTNEASVIARGMNEVVKVTNEIKTHEIPKLNIAKSSDKKSYKVNEIAKYTVTVKNEGKFDAHNISVKDKFKQEGLMSIDMDSVMINGKKASFDKLQLESLKSGEVMTITYDAKVLKDVNAEVVNTATVTADYMETILDKDGNRIVKDPKTATNTVKIEKTPIAPLIKTGDETRLLSYGVVLLGAVLALIVAVKRRKAHN